MSVLQAAPSSLILSGLSTDTKPVGPQLINALFKETDSGNVYQYLSTATGLAWINKIAPTAIAGSGGPLTSDLMGRLITGTDNELFFDQVDGTSVDIRKWIQSTTTMTIAQAGGAITLNNSAITTINTSAQLTSIKQFQLYGEVPLSVSFGVQTNVGPQTNAVMEIGLFTASGTSAPTDGMLLRLSSAGLQGVINYNGTETVGTMVNTTTFAPTTWTTGVVHQLQMILANTASVVFILDSVNVAFVNILNTQPFVVSNSRQPVSVRTYTGGSAPATAPQILIERVNVFQGAFPQSRNWEDMLLQNGNGIWQAPIAAFAQTANHTNSTDPTSATLSNTAAGYTTLGGRFQFAAVAGAITDYALFAYQVPAGFQLNLKSVSISLVNLGAAVATTATVCDWSLGVNASAVSLATVDGAGTWAPRRIPLGLQSFVVGAAIGTQAVDRTLLFQNAVVIDGGRYVHIILEMPVGTATASQILRGDVTFSGWFE